jgi:hypothetical protein
VHQPPREESHQKPWTHEKTSTCNRSSVHLQVYVGGLCKGGWIGQVYPGSCTAILSTVHWRGKAGSNAAANDNLQYHLSVKKQGIILLLFLPNCYHLIKSDSFSQILL